MVKFVTQILSRPARLCRVNFLISVPAILLLLTPTSSTSPTSGHCNGQATWSHHLRNFTMDTGPSRLLVVSHDLHLPCPAAPMASSGTLTLQNVSVCPWTQAVHYDFDRFPHAMTYARCSCGGCSNETPGVVRGGRRRCVPLYHTFHVLRRVCEAGNFRFMVSFDRLPIACVCAHVIEEGASAYK